MQDCVSVVNPARVRQFARASGQLTKTDKLDAFVLAARGNTMQPSLRDSVERSIAFLKEEKKLLEEQIQEFRKEQKGWQGKRRS